MNKLSLILAFACCFSIIGIAQTQKINQLESLISKAKFDKAEKFVSKMIKSKHNIDLSNLWFYKGKIKYQKYLLEIKEVAGNDLKTYLSYNALIDDAIFAFQESYDLGDVEQKEVSLQQMEDIYTFFKIISRRYFDLEMYERFYINSQRALNCNKFVVDHSTGAKLDTMLLYENAYAAQLSNRNEEAIHLYDNLIELGSSYDKLYKNYTHLCLIKKDTVKALGQLNLVTLKFPKNKALFDLKISTLQQLKSFEEAGDYLEKGLVDFPNSKEEISYKIGRNYHEAYLYDFGLNQKINNDFYQKAEKAYLVAIAFNGNNYDYLYNLATLHYKKAIIISPLLENDLAMQKEYVSVVDKAKNALQIAHAVNNEEPSIIGALQKLNQNSNQNNGY